MIMLKNAHTYNTGLAKVAVQCSADTFMVNQIWFSASTFVVKIATFAKPENVSGNYENTLRLGDIDTILNFASGLNSRKTANRIKLKLKVQKLALRQNSTFDNKTHT